MVEKIIAKIDTQIEKLLEKPELTPEDMTVLWAYVDNSERYAAAKRTALMLELAMRRPDGIGGDCCCDVRN